VEPAPDGSVLLSPRALSDINMNLSLLESNLGKQRQLLTSLNNELSVAALSLTTLKGLYNEQSLLVMSLRVWTEQLGERLSASEHSLAWAMEDAATLETELERERANNTRLDRSAHFWRTVAIVAGVLVLGAGVAAVAW
jgi:chromosome segregation ATPase